MSDLRKMMKTIIEKTERISLSGNIDYPKVTFQFLDNYIPSGSQFFVSINVHVPHP